jgi:long-chain acyl-CoA synthetase
MPINQILVHSESRAIIIGKLDSLESQQSGIPTYTKFAWAFMAMMGTLWEDIISNSQEITTFISKTRRFVYHYLYLRDNRRPERSDAYGQYMESVKAIHCWFQRIIQNYFPSYQLPI